MTSRARKEGAAPQADPPVRTDEHAAAAHREDQEAACWTSEEGTDPTAVNPERTVVAEISRAEANDLLRQLRSQIDPPTPRNILEYRQALRALHEAMDNALRVHAAGASPRRRSVLELAADVLDDPGPWLRAPNSQLGDRRPIDLVGTEEEFRVSNLLTAIDHGLF